MGLINTGYRIYPKLVKVSDDINQFPLDVNNHKSSESGLPQDSMNMPTNDPRYRVLDSTCNTVVPSFTFTSPWNFTDTGALNTSTTRTYTSDTLPTGSLWTSSTDKYSIKISWENSANCGGTNNKVQSGTATATINSTVSENIGISWTGLAELQDTGFENMTVKVDNTIIGTATSAGGQLGCQMGDIVTTNNYPSGYPLSPGSHTISITTTTADALFHVNSFYAFTFTKIS